MRLWSLHPKYLDAKGLMALWREALLAQKVLHGQTRGYKYHPQLERFRAADDPLAAIADYLRVVAAEAGARGYDFDMAKIAKATSRQRLSVSSGQMAYEMAHLRRKLRVRDRKKLHEITKLTRIDPHPLFRTRAGGVAAWERRK